MFNRKYVFASAFLLIFVESSVILPLNSLCRGKWVNYPICRNKVLHLISTEAWNNILKNKEKPCPPEWSEELCKDFMNNFPGAEITEVIPAEQNTAKPSTTKPIQNEVTPTSTPTIATGGCTPFPIWLPGTGQTRNCSDANQSSLTPILPISQYGCTKDNLRSAWCRLFYFMYLQSGNAYHAELKE